jgi:carbamoyl-phosphate synthase large subunit
MSAETPQTVVPVRPFRGFWIPAVPLPEPGSIRREAREGRAAAAEEGVRGGTWLVPPRLTFAAVPSAGSPVVLFTCAGQRVDIVEAFGRAGATTLAVDANELAPALYAAHRRALVPPIVDRGYVPALGALVAEHGASLVVPLADLDHRLLASRRGELGALLLLPGSETITLCEDKYEAHCFFEQQGIPTPPTWQADDLPADLEFPVLVKARRGFGSRHIFRAVDRCELDFFLGYTTVDSMVQSVCRGEEFSIDVFCDLEGSCLNAVPRTMIESKGGESIKGMTIKDAELIEHGRRVAEAMRMVGPANIQCFREPDGSLPVTDVNPRFGGGFPAPTAAGSRYPELALALARGERPEPRLGDFREGIVMTRYFSQVILRNVDGTLVPAVEEPSGSA